MLLLLCRQGAWPNKRPRPMPAGPGGKDVVVEFLARDSFHGPAEAGHVVAVELARRFDHAAPIPRQSCKIKGCAEVGCTLEASPSLRRIRSFDATVHAPYARGIPKRTFAGRSARAAIDPRGHAQQPADLDEPAGCAHQRTCVAQGRTRIIVFPLPRSVGFKAATASSRVETLPMLVRSRPSRTR
jgi:hypothetical protein